RVVAAKACTERGELVAQFPEVVDLAVEDDRERAVVALHRLVPALDVENGEAAKAEVGASLDVGQQPVVIGAAVHEAARHPLQDRLVAFAEKAGNSAHPERVLSSSCTRGACSDGKF